MAGTTPSKRKILCLEGLWDNNLEQRLSVKPLLEIISKSPDLRQSRRLGYVNRSKRYLEKII